MMTPRLEALFMRRVEVTETCWLWVGHVDPNGYGTFSFKDEDGKGRWVKAHRWHYEQQVGSVGDLTLDHLCRVRRCVRLSHLEPVTGQENILRGNTLAAANAAKTHCPQGHEYVGENLLVSKDGRRVCRTCNRERCRRYYYRLVR